MFVYVINTNQEKGHCKCCIYIYVCVCVTLTDNNLRLLVVWVVFESKSWNFIEDVSVEFAFLYLVSFFSCFNALNSTHRSRIFVLFHILMYDQMVWCCY